MPVTAWASGGGRPGRPDCDGLHVRFVRETDPCQGTGFNWPEPDHVRLVTLPHKDQLRDALTRIATFLET